MTISDSLAMSPLLCPLYPQHSHGVLVLLSYLLPTFLPYTRTFSLLLSGTQRTTDGSQIAPDVC